MTLMDSKIKEQVKKLEKQFILLSVALDETNGRFDDLEMELNRLKRLLNMEVTDEK